MHESGLIEDLLNKVEAVAKENAGGKVVAIEVSIGPMANIEAAHLKEHFEIAKLGTMAQDAELRVTEADALSARDPAGIVLESVEIETE